MYERLRRQRMGLLRTHASFSPDGARIAVGKSGIKTMRAMPTVVGGLFECDEKRLSDFRGHQPTWSPDGRLIAFIAADTSGLRVRVK